MGTLKTKLKKAIATKEALAAALRDAGQTVPAKFADYPAAFRKALGLTSGS